MIAFPGCMFLDAGRREEKVCLGGGRGAGVVNGLGHTTVDLIM